MFFGILISQEEEESYVVAGATLCCSMGERTSQLQLPMSHGLYMNGKAQVNIKDREPNVNILPFGMCKLGGVCSPKIDMDWTDERSSKMVDGEPAVSNKSKLMCLYGGTIRIEDDGQEIGSGEKEESFWSELWEQTKVLSRNELWGQTKAFFDGASDAAADDFTLGTLPNEKYTGFKDYSSKYPLSRKAGEVAGNLLGLVVGGAETIIGTGGAVIGGAASVTGVGGSVGVPLTGGSVAVAAHGVSMSTKAALGTGKSANEFWNMFANHNGTKGTGKGPKIKLTEPSLPKGSKPKGNYGEGDSHGIKKQNETADFLADKGYDIEMLDEIHGGNGYGILKGSNPDFLIEGNVFDCYAPKPDGKVQSIIKELAGKTKKQSGRIVLNLDDFPDNKVVEVTETIFRKVNPNGDLKRLEELLIVKDGTITRLFGGKK
ncbi:PAAR-like protein [Aneurinibacillus aneurinilyticus]|uniref:PAAR-like protein n=1 Tax=Aneurinibacillus aneurinilyticus TaxID=1391 RepID=UPI002E210D06|nr:PAAR-like protein [Aneurinibacillus aneurinilyticus]MED0726393.1 PAAR-like protein [Aneurinibacillus aneurinilyticus]MED0735184.1 PAAR-like protein [Aneurinibacillus aneurinilyticus]MED0743541.1 PAAR-like protein [Aneurinibacillus aneurinilyticus]